MRFNSHAVCRTAASEVPANWKEGRVLGEQARLIYAGLRVAGCPVELELAGLCLGTWLPEDPEFFDHLGICRALLQHVENCPRCRPTVQSRSQAA